MATIAYDSFGDKPAAKPPISVHPAFPAVVALWFSALLGLGSLVLPEALLDRLVVATGLASLLPAAAPPLGFAARALIALVAASAGALLGMAIARRVAKAHTQEPETRISKLAGGLNRPISVHEELGGEGLVNGRAPPITRRRALAISEDERPSDFLYVVPLPGEEPQGEPVAESNAPAPGIEPLELCDMVDDQPDSAMAASDALKEPNLDEVAKMIETPDFQPTSPFQDDLKPQDEPDGAEELDARKNAAGPRGLEPLPFSAPSLARRAPESVEEPVIEIEPEMETETEHALQAVAAEPEHAAVRADWADAPVEQLGLVQLVQRLGSTIERRREWMAERATTAQAPALAPLSGVEAAPAEEAAQAMAAYFGSTERVEESAPRPPFEPENESGSDEAPQPEFIRRLTPAVIEDEDSEDVFPDFTLPLHRAPAAPAAVTENEEDSGEAEERDFAESGEDYGSLLAMNNPFVSSEPEFVRIEEPEPEAEAAQPVVVFPGRDEPASADSFGSAPAQRLFDPPGKARGANTSVPPSSGESDVALRAALATLQRMSGAA